MRARLCCLAILAGVIAAASGPQPASAQDLNRVVRTLNAILNPQDAQRLEEQARRAGREDEERYWREYRAGLEHQRHEREGSYAPGYRDRPYHDIGPDEARRFEEQSRRARRFEEERYWHEYRGDFANQNRDRGIGWADARRYEERARRNHRFEEERYWREYGAGLNEHGPDRDSGYNRGR